MPNWKKVITSGSDAALNGVSVDGTLVLNSVVNAATDTDKFLVLDSSGNVDFRTGANVLSDIGAQAAGSYLTTATTFGGDVSGTYNAIVVGNDSHTHNANNLTGTTLASGVVNSSLTSVGTIGTGTWQGTAIGDSYISSAATWNAKLDSAGTITNLDYARFDSNGDLTGRSYSEVKSDLSLGNVENTALSTWAGSSNITTLGTIGTGTWAATDVAVAHGGTGASTAANARTNLGLEIGVDVQAYNTTLQAVATSNYTGDNAISTVGTITTGTWQGTDVGIAHGGTGTSLADPNADRIMFWDESAGVGGSVNWLQVGTGLSIVGTTLSATAAGGGYEWYDGTTYTTASVDVHITSSLNLYKSGTLADPEVFVVDGAQGRLLEITDQLSGSLFAVNNISGVPVFEVFSDDTITLGSYNDEAIIVNGNSCIASGSFTGSFDGRFYAEAGSNLAPAYTFIGDTDTGFYRGTTNTISIAVAGTQIGTINTNGWRVNNGALGVNVAANATNGRIDAGNDIVAFSTSDERLKENVKPIENALDKVSKIGGYEFDWKELTEEEKKTIHGNEGHDVGVIAQEIEKVLPEVVTERDSGYKAVKYEKIVPLLIESIKELKAEIEELKGRL